MIPLLAPLFQGDLAPFGERLQCVATPPDDAVRLRELMAPSRVRSLLQRAAQQRGSDTRDLRPVASAWSLAYLAALLPPVAAAATVLGHVFPVGADDVWLTLDGQGDPDRFYIGHTGFAAPDATAPARYELLVRHHLQPLFTVLSAESRLPSKVLWGNAAREFDVVFDQAIALTGLASVVEDRDRLLRDRHWPAPGPGAQPTDNPFHGRQREVVHPNGDHEDRLVLHRQCCLMHLLPGESHCHACPLSPVHRQPDAPRRSVHGGARG